MRIRNTQGFTLIEVLTALSVFSLVAVAIYSVFSTGIAAREKGESASSLCQDARIALDRMSKELRNTAGVSLYRFVGSPDMISFPTLEERRGHLEICYVTYYLETKEGNGSKTLRRTEETPVEGKSEPRDIASSVAEVKLTYRYKAADTGSYEWCDSWDSSLQASYPLDVRISLTLTEHDGHQIPFTKTVHIPIDSSFRESQL